MCIGAQETLVSRLILESALVYRRHASTLSNGGSAEDPRPHISPVARGSETAKSIASLGLGRFVFDPY